MNTRQATELDRIQKEYERRATEPSYARRYSIFRPDNLHKKHSHERSLLALLHRQGMTHLPEYRVLDVGCGSGHGLLRWIDYGCQPEHCAGIDLMPDLIAQARGVLPPAVKLHQGDASYLPYADASFDLVYQGTVFSSILDQAMRQAVASEMLRVLRPDGMIIWRDFWWNPLNRQTRGIGLKEVRALFPGCRCDARLVTLAPPLARLVVPRSWILASLLEKLPFLCTHWLVGIRKHTDQE
jgi:ubiquinone/menaquinone biosynthesis C-methylase UbiE